MYKTEALRQETLFGPLAPLLNIGYITGAAPYPMCTKHLSTLQKFIRLIQIVYESVLVSGLITSIVLLRTQIKEFNIAEHAPPFIKLFHIVEHVLDIFLVIVICFVEQFMRVSFKELWDQLDDLLQMFGHVSATILNQRKLFAITAVLSNMAVQLVVVWSVLDAVQNIRVVPLLVTVHVPLTLTIVFVHLYCLVVTTIARMIQEINIQLEDYVKRIKVPFIQEKPPHSEISRLREIHLQLVDMLEQLNDATGVIIISILSSTFANMNSNSLFLYTKIKDDERPPGFTRSIVEILLLMLLRILKVLTVIIPNSLVKIENHKTAKILCKFKDSENIKFNLVVSSS